MDGNRGSGSAISFADIKNYLKTGTILYSATGTLPNDLLGNAYGPFTVDSIPKVPTSTFNSLSDVADNTFWSPYY